MKGWKKKQLMEKLERFKVVMSKHSKFDLSSYAKCQTPTTPLGVLCEKNSRSTNVIGLVVNIEGAKGFSLSPNYLRFRDHDLVGGFP